MTMLDRGRVLPGQRLPEPIIKAAYGTGAIVNPLAQTAPRRRQLGAESAAGRQHRRAESRRT